MDEYEGEKGWKYVPARDELIRGVTFVAEWKAEKTDSSTGNGSIQGYKLNADGTAEYKKQRHRILKRLSQYRIK